MTEYFQMYYHTGQQANILRSNGVQNQLVE